MIFIGCLLVAWVLGSIPFGVIIGKLWLGVDIRQKGSGNIGMTNVIRVGGKLPGLLTFILDFAKGTLAVWIAMQWLDSEADPSGYVAQLSLVGVVAICGHVFSIFLKFQGGKGISTLFGTLAILNFPVGLSAAVIWVGTFLAKKISSLAAITTLGSLPFLFIMIPWVQGYEIYWNQVIIFLGLSGLLLFRHRDNIKRLLSGTERQLKSKDSSI